jgi:PAS domain S-box-containing protein
MSPTIGVGQVMIWRSGPDKACDWFNQAWLDFVGRALEEEVGDGWTQGVHPDDLAHCFEVYSTSFDARRPFSMSYRLRRHDGVYRWVLDIGKPFERDGVFAGYFGTCIDITDNKGLPDDPAWIMARRSLSAEERVALVVGAYRRVNTGLQHLQAPTEPGNKSESQNRSLLADRISDQLVALAAIKRKLLQGPDASKANARSLIESVCSDARERRNGSAKDVKFRLEVDNFEIPSERAIVLGVLINALIRDTISRANRAELAADITVGARIGRDGVLLEVIDGAPIPPDGPHDALTLSDFVRRLGGKISVLTTSGSNVRILLP